ncbi:MAG: hypothetical protein IJ631_02850 [Schwartzia sp.]|nr:hypothetical protein [Schwartzia sp. (in: firmicutes)]
MNRFFKFGGRVVASALLCGSMMLGTAAAEEASAMDGMAAFREAISTPAKPDKRVFRQDLQFFIPAVRANLDLMGYARGHNLRISGGLEFLCTGEDGNTTEVRYPFFLDQKKKEMTLYFKTDKEWRKFQTPTVAAAAADTMVTPDERDIDDILSTVKEVTVLRETDTQRTMLVQLDNEKLADLIARYGKTNPPDKGTADDPAWQNSFMGLLEQGMRRANVWYTWTVDKTDWQTITMSYNLSSWVQETARVALAQPHTWPKDVEELVERLAYYSDMKTYTTFLNPDAKKLIELPEEAKNAKLVEDVIGDEVALPEGAQAK